ncbi:MAG: transporter substrate-binding domain-containing protein [Alcanivoracaceae bacterium]|nr:transporter substrate-binding domain-containing protein [Alcanivoracaceae bacterium]
MRTLRLRNLNTFLLSLISALCLAACDKPNGEQAAGKPFENYVETGDLSELRERGYVRLLAPRFDDDLALPRDGFPIHTYREVAEDFVTSLGLTPEWVYADDFSNLINLLNNGAADLIVTNLTHTVKREEKIAFSAPLAVVQEALILPSAMKGKALDSLGALTVTVPEGTAWRSTLERLALENPNFSVALAPGTLSDWEMLDGVADGTYQATVLDSDIADSIVPLVPGVVIGPVISKDREIAWAMRTDNKALRHALNEFLVATRVVASRAEKEKRLWADIKQSGTLRVITTNNPASYFLWRGELMGFDYELINEFAKNNKLRVSVIVRDSPEEMYVALQSGYGDVIAASMTESEERKAKGWTFSRRYLVVTEKLVGAAGAKDIVALEQLNGKTIAVNPQHSYFETLTALKNSGVSIKVVEVPNATSEMLIAEVAEGQFDYTIADSHLAAMETTFRDDIRVVYDFAEPKNIGWVVRKDQAQLLAALNQYARKSYKSLHYNIYFNRYFNEPKSITKYREDRVEPGKAISPYDELVYEHALENSLDWRLLTAQMYQESRFNPKAQSYAGAVGLMQVLPRTGRQFGYKDVRPPEKNVAASVDFMHWLQDRFPHYLPIEERVYFTLAAYNAGHGHVQDARRLAKQLGKNPDVWFGNVESAMLLLSQPKYFRRARFGYVRGTEPVGYVRDIRERYVLYLKADVKKPRAND